MHTLPDFLQCSFTDLLHGPAVVKVLSKLVDGGLQGLVQRNPVVTKQQHQPRPQRVQVWPTEDCNALALVEGINTQVN